ncbi:uncharacterized protein DUF1541 [Planomicrobium soli]|uniref:Uncharacterized protein DUF1541 n=1 Tax=Planomicrobium soli TaxID=1176648 RepID=A0A2P8H470_9BACL|nr:YdhK family protein [Planomicrobium soli]PSL40990.1 uncharacterized protein DUF1541 [Planomicrobium soli]
MPKSKWSMMVLSLLAALMLGACSTGGGTEEGNHDMQGSEENQSSHAHMDHSGSAEVPDGLEEAKDPAFKVEDTAILNADHMEGMDGAEATIVGAYDTVAYSVTYTPTTGGEPVKNHKWIIHEELKDPGNKLLEKGDTATLAADHMEGMNGAEATIDSSEKTTVYMVDFTPTSGGEKVTNHKWLTEDELSPQ